MPCNAGTRLHGGRELPEGWTGSEERWNYPDDPLLASLWDKTLLAHNEAGNSK